MKKIEQFLRENPSYIKCGNEKIAKYAKVAMSTVLKFKKTSAFQEIKQTYLSQK